MLKNYFENVLSYIFGVLLLFLVLGIIIIPAALVGLLIERIIGPAIDPYLPNYSENQEMLVLAIILGIGWLILKYMTNSSRMRKPLKDGR